MNALTKDLTRLYHIRDAIDLILSFSSGITIDIFFADEMRKAAIVRQFEIIGEAANHISPITKELDNSIPWEILRSLRNRLIHEYFRVDISIVWTTIQHDIAPLKEQINILINYIESSISID